MIYIREKINAPINNRNMNKPGIGKPAGTKYSITVKEIKEAINNEITVNETESMNKELNSI
jgi:predicted transcriptional regulator